MCRGLTRTDIQTGLTTRLYGTRDSGTEYLFAGQVYGHAQGLRLPHLLPQGVGGEVPSGLTRSEDAAGGEYCSHLIEI